MDSTLYNDFLFSIRQLRPISHEVFLTWTSRPAGHESAHAASLIKITGLVDAAFV